ncbi:MAG: hypothetical protein F6K32_10745 [Desertifilum sp. SIO1I2]|nr:hypothetical protein [Desertifilum sp. SIO1I2]
MSQKTVGQQFRWRNFWGTVAGLTLVAFIHAVPSFLSLPNKAKQSAAKAELLEMNHEQQQAYVQQGTFLRGSNRQSSLNAYRFSTQHNGDAVYSKAIPIREYEFSEFFIFPWNRFVPLRSYIGVVIVTNAQKRETLSTICATHSQNQQISLIQQSGELTCD